MTETGPADRPLEAARLAMEAEAENEGLRRGFLARLAETEMFLLMQEEAGADAADPPMSPAVFAVAEGRVVLAFDSEAALAAFTGAPAPYAAMPGRALALWLAGEGVGLGVNLTEAGEGTLLPPEALDWLAEVLGAAPPPQPVEGIGPDALGPPPALDPALLPALERALARAGALARGAVLASARYGSEDGAEDRTGRLLIAFLDAEAGAEAALSRAVQEALVAARLAAMPPGGPAQSDPETAEGSVDIAFLPASAPAAERLRAVGLALELPDPRPAPVAPPAPPGLDPQRPPKLR